MRWLLLLFIFPVFADFKSDYDGCKKEIESIDKQIEALSKDRDQHGKKSIEYQREGDKWQYSQSGSVQNAYDAWAKADAERKQMNEIQIQIDALKLRKARILQFYPQLNNP